MNRSEAIDMLTRFRLACGSLNDPRRPSRSPPSRVINGNSGKGLSGTFDGGRFTGWTMLGVDPDAGVVGTTPTVVEDRIGWMQAETKPRVDELALVAPTVLDVGETVPVSATSTQDGGREVPLQWPVSADWSGSGVEVV